MNSLSLWVGFAGLVGWIVALRSLAASAGHEEAAKAWAGRAYAAENALLESKSEISRLKESLATYQEAAFEALTDKSEVLMFRARFKKEEACNPSK